MIPESFIQELLARVDIVDVVERFVTLRKAGANYSACCPFHSEKTPSFTVSASKQFYHCFGCGAHGSAIGFLMQYSGLGFIEAVEDLAHNAGMQVPQVSERIHTDRARKAPLTELMAGAARFYKEQLKVSPKAVDYLKGRGLTGEIAARFGLGYAPDEWQGLQKIFPDYNDTALTECGLVIENEQGRRYDRFRDRVMFPILDQRGNVIGFGGRFIGDHKAAQAENAAAGPKYLNSPKLLRQASKVVFCGDGDAAGRKAAWRALEASLEQLSDDRTVGFLFLPPEHDPDSFVRAEGAADFRQRAAHPTSLTEFLMRELTAGLDLERSAEDRARLVHEAKPFLQKLAAPAGCAPSARSSSGSPTPPRPRPPTWPRPR
ncbi:MAG: hypothetical protein HZC24_00590 [Rhodocyclales bacterium]|nr:hypothetical protein [Rhodocyclales bacterium]